jgi:hypothetical protein
MDGWEIIAICTTDKSCSQSSGCGTTWKISDIGIEKKIDWSNDWKTCYYHKCFNCGNHIKIEQEKIPYNVQQYAGSLKQRLKFIFN